MGNYGYSQVSKKTNGINNEVNDFIILRREILGQKNTNKNSFQNKLNMVSTRTLDVVI